MLLNHLLEHSPPSQKSIEGSLDLLPCHAVAAVSLLRLRIVPINRSATHVFLQPVRVSSASYALLMLDRLGAVAQVRHGRGGKSVSIHRMCDNEDRRSGSNASSSCLYSSPMPTWFVVMVRSRGEKKVARLLAAKGFEVFLPVVRRAQKWTDRTKEIDFPLFACAIFCRFEPPQRLAVMKTPGVLHLAGANGSGVPSGVPLSDLVMNDLQLLYRQFDCRVTESLIDANPVAVQIGEDWVKAIPVAGASDQVAINIEPLKCAAIFTTSLPRL